MLHVRAKYLPCAIVTAYKSCQGRGKTPRKHKTRRSASSYIHRVSQYLDRVLSCQQYDEICLIILNQPMLRAEPLNQ